MRGLERYIADALNRPERVVQSQSDAETLLFYRLIEKTRVSRKWLCVAVKYRAGEAFVLTAYLTDKPKKGTQLWPST